MLKHNDLIQIAQKWLKKAYCPCREYGHSACSVVLSELVTATTTGEIPDVIGFTSTKSILIECKTSLSDFRRDMNKTFRQLAGSGVGSLRWYLAPMEIISIDFMPPDWGLIEVTDDKKITVVKNPKLQHKNFQAEITMLVSHIRRMEKDVYKV